MIQQDMIGINPNLSCENLATNHISNNHIKSYNDKLIQQTNPNITIVKEKRIDEQTWIERNNDQ